MAPPNSSNFSVSVVLPASGCEMIANVRRRRISSARSVMSVRQSGGRGVRVAQHALEHGGILAAARRLVVAAAHADLLEPERQVQADGRRVGRAHLEKGLAHSSGGGTLDE